MMHNLINYLYSYNVIFFKPGCALLLMMPWTSHLLRGRGGFDVERIVGLLLLSGFSPLRVRTKKQKVLTDREQLENLK